MATLKLTDKDKRIRTNILKFIKEGLRPAEAAVLAGIARETLWRWREKDATFATKIEAAEIEFESSLVKNVRKIGIDTKNGNVLQTLLSTRFKERWSPKVTQEMTGPNGDSVVFKVDVSGGYIPPANVMGLPSTLSKGLEEKNKPS